MLHPSITGTLSVSVAVLLGLSMETITDKAAPPLVFAVAILFSAWWGGPRAGMVATFLAIPSIAFLFLGERFQLELPTGVQTVNLLLLIAVGAFASYAMSIMQPTRRLALDRPRTSPAKQGTLLSEQTQALRRSMEELRRSERLAAIGTLAAGIAHEVNNPLNAILLTAECALRQKDLTHDPAEIREWFEIISQEARRGGRRLQSVLRFARTESTNKEPSDLNAVVADAVELARTYTHSNTLKLSTRLADELPAVSINATEVEQVVLNLVKRAVDAAGRPVHVQIETRTARGGVELLVYDDGPQIPEEDTPHLFEPLYSTRWTSAGSMLGLSISHEIITDHEGSMSVSSSSGNGTTFTIWLPTDGRWQTHQPRKSNWQSC